MEIIAQKKRGLSAELVTSFIVGAVFLAAAVVVGFTFKDAETYQLILLIVIFAFTGAWSIGLSIYNYLRIRKTPDCITLNGNQVDLGNGLIVNIRQITDVDYRESRARYRSYSWGTLTVYLENQKINYYYIADVRHARDRIMQLIWLAKEN